MATFSSRQSSSNFMVEELFPGPILKKFEKNQGVQLFCLLLKQKYICLEILEKIRSLWPLTSGTNPVHQTHQNRLKVPVNSKNSLGKFWATFQKLWATF